MKPAALRRIAWTAALLLLAGIGVLVFDWVAAARQAPKDERLVKSLQQQVKEDATVAPKLEAEQKRITGALLSRRARGRAVGWGVVALSAVFLGSVKRLVAPGGRKAVEKSRIVEASRPPLRKRRKRKRAGGSGGTAETGAGDGFVDEAVARYGRSKEAAIPLLQAIQQHYRYLPDDALLRLCEITDITPADIAGTSSFYGQFRRSPAGRRRVRVCHGTACHVAGARQISDELRRRLKIADGDDTDADRRFTLEEVACLGCCSLAPVLMVDEHTAGRLTASSAADALEQAEEEEPA